MEERVSKILPSESISEAIYALPDVFKKILGEEIVTVTYEVGCNLHVDLWYQPMSVGTAWMDRFIRDSLDQRIVIPGESDFRFIIPPNRLQVLFCHERDIHLSGNDHNLLGDLLQEDPFRGFEFVTTDVGKEDRSQGDTPAKSSGSIY